jgi:ribonuclease HI
MTETIRIWASAAHHPAFRCGGWAWVRSAGGALSGAAGGERYTTPRRMALAGLVSALRDLPKTPGPIAIQTTSPELAALASVLTGKAPRPDGDPDEDLDLLAQIAAATAGRAVTIVRVVREPRAPAAFTGAWADLAMDKAKATGPFSSAIPKTNLAKLQGLPAR